jgi:hypothetical protein
MKARNSIVLGLLAVSLGAFDWMSSRQPSQRPAATEEPSETARELSALRAEVTELRARQDKEVRLLGAKAASDVAAAPAKEPEALTMEQKVVKNEQRNARIADFLAQRLQNERVDADWSATASAQIRTAFKTSLPGTDVMDAQCASTLCRVVVRHGEKADQATMAQKLVREEPFSLGTFYRYDTKADPPTTTLYVLRDGQVPPEVGNL